MSVNQLISISQSNFNFVKAAIDLYDLPTDSTDDYCKNFVNADYAGGWNQFCFDCLIED